MQKGARDEKYQGKQGGGGVSWTHMSESTVKARKQHTCCLCGLIIPKGCTYRRRTGIGDDGWITMPMHVQCEAATHEWSCEDWESDDSWSFRNETLTPETLAEITSIQPATTGASK